MPSFQASSIRRAASGCLILATLFAESSRAQTTPDLVAQPGAGAVPDFAIVSIKQNTSLDGPAHGLYTEEGVDIGNMPLNEIIQMAYAKIGSSDQEFSGFPSWATTERFDIQAKVDPSDLNTLHKLDPAQRGLMMQRMLADRFKLKVHEQPKEQSGYALTIAKAGLKVTQTEPARGMGVISRNDHQIKAQGYPLSSFVVPLTQIVGRTVQDRTGLQGFYTFTLNWRPDSDAASADADTANTPRDAAPSIFTALEEQLGLKLVPIKVPAMLLVVDHVEKPESN